MSSDHKPVMAWFDVTAQNVIKVVFFLESRIFERFEFLSFSPQELVFKNLSPDSLMLGKTTKFHRFSTFLKRISPDSRERRFSSNTLDRLHLIGITSTSWM